MTVYIDQPRFKKKGGKIQYCHMCSSISVDELHSFARLAGISRSWYNVSNSGIPHYDLNPENRLKIKLAGAVEVNRFGFKKSFPRQKKRRKTTLL